MEHAEWKNNMFKRNEAKSSATTLTFLFEQPEPAGEGMRVAQMFTEPWKIAARFKGAVFYEFIQFFMISLM